MTFFESSQSGIGSSHRSCSVKKLFLKILQYSQENTCVPATVLKRDSTTGVFLWILRFLRTPSLMNISEMAAFMGCRNSLWRLRTNTLKFFMNWELELSVLTVTNQPLVTRTFCFGIAEAADGGVLWKKVLIEISQNSQENTCARGSFLIKLQASGLQIYLKRASGTGVFLWILWSF